MPETQTKKYLAAELECEITAEIHAILEARGASASAHGPEFAELWQLATSCIGGGKLLRPHLLLGTFDALTAHGDLAAESRADAVRLAAALEILHFSFLLHDDVIDEDLLRRGEPNLVGHLVSRGSLRRESGRSELPYDHTHWARSSAILVGDLMLTIAHQVFARARLSDERRTRVLDLLESTVAETVAGEYYDVGLADGCIDPRLTLVLDMTRMKTASYTFELPLRLAAVLAGAGHTTERRLGDIGRHLGVAFQLRDDVLSAFGPSETHGKDTFSDFREGKETALIAFARMTDAWPTIEPLLGAHDFSAQSGETIQRELVECGAREYVESLSFDHTRTAHELLADDAGPLPDAAARFIWDVADSLSGRRS